MAEEKVKANDLVEIIGTGKSKHLVKGAKKVVHKIAADKLVALGVATIGEAIATPSKQEKGKKGPKLEM